MMYDSGDYVSIHIISGETKSRKYLLDVTIPVEN